MAGRAPRSRIDRTTEASIATVLERERRSKLFFSYIERLGLLGLLQYLAEHSGPLKLPFWGLYFIGVTFLASPVATYVLLRFDQRWPSIENLPDLAIYGFVLLLTLMFVLAATTGLTMGIGAAIAATVG